MKIYKDLEHSVSVTPFSWRGKQYLMLSVGLYIGFDPISGKANLRNEQDFWKEAPEIFAQINEAPVLDVSLPKNGAEVLVAGSCRSLDKKLVDAQEVSFKVGQISRRFHVFGDREVYKDGSISAPIPFHTMPLTWKHAFGGPSFEQNTEGKGLNENNKRNNVLPNIENPDNLILSSKDIIAPVCPFPINMANPARRALSGTYDKQWLETRWPDYADDCQAEFFYSAQKEQRLESIMQHMDLNHDKSNNDDAFFFQGNEEIEIIGMHHEFPHIHSHLPDLRLRAFILSTENFIPFAPPNTGNDKQNPLPYAKNYDEQGIFSEVDLHCDTVWLLPDLLGAFVLRRGLIEV